VTFTPSPTNDKDMRLRTSLYAHDHAEIARLIASGANVNAVFGDTAWAQMTPLQIALWEGDVEASRLLLAAGAKVEWMADRGAGYIEKVSVLSTFLISDQVASRHRDTAPQLCAMLLAAGANPNPDGHDDVPQMSPLCAAANRHHVLCFNMLLAAGADINGKSLEMSPIKQIKGLVRRATPIEDRAACGVMLATLLKHGADDRALADGYRKLSPFQICVMNGLNAAVEFFVRERGEDLAQRTDDGRTLMQIAGTPEVKTLLRALKTELVIKGGLQSDHKASGSSASQRRDATPL
jgi:ankyrin repeat protein